MRLPNKIYDILKWAGLIAFPAVATFIGIVFPAWGVDANLVKSIVTTLNATGVLVGTLIGVSTVSKPKEKK